MSAHPLYEYFLSPHPEVLKTSGIVSAPYVMASQLLISLLYPYAEKNKTKIKLTHLSPQP
jgi:hypothetical protein